MNARPVLVLLCAALLLAATGCTPKVINVPETPAGTPPQKFAPVMDQSLYGQAERAWKAGNMGEAERLYGILARSPQTSAEQRAVAQSRLVDAALKNRHGLAALEGLDLQRQTDPTLTQKPEWQRNLGLALIQLPSAEALRRAAGAAGEQSMPLTLRAQAAGVALLTTPPEGRVTWLEALNGLHQSADRTQKGIMERGLYVLLPQLKPEVLAALVDYSLPDTDHTFPWNVLVLDQAVREKRKLPVVATAAGVPAVDRLGSNTTIFNDTALLGDAMNGKVLVSTVPVPVAGGMTSGTAVAGPVDFSAGCTVLALPMSGNFAGVGNRVALGAEAAKRRLASQNIAAEVIVLDSEKVEWLDQLAGLPPHCAVVGGPLRPDVYNAAKARGLTSQRLFFTFTSALEGNDEGTVAWRFFNSLDDQVQAMLRLAEASGVNSFGVLYPEENYGHRMADLFRGAAGPKVVKTAAYAPAEPQSWNGTVQQFLNSSMQGKTPVSGAQFQGLFMPDSWAKSAGLIPFLFFHGEDRLLLMGTALWEQGINQAKLDQSNMALVVFPGAWNSATPSAAAANLISQATSMGQAADFWMALGYDMVRFSSALNLTGYVPAAAVNQRLAAAQNMTWSMAPLRWTPDGKVSQQMFAFSPTPEGIVIAQPDVLRQKIDEIRARYQRRVSTPQQ